MTGRYSWSVNGDTLSYYDGRNTRELVMSEYQLIQIGRVRIVDAGKLQVSI